MCTEKSVVKYFMTSSSTIDLFAFCFLRKVTVNKVVCFLALKRTILAFSSAP